MACQHIATVSQITKQTASRKSILYSLAAACDMHGRWPLDRSLLAVMSGLSERALRENLRKLREQGLVEVIDDVAWLRL